MTATRVRQPISLRQRRLWLLEQEEPGTPVNNLSLALRLIGDVDREALGEALNWLVANNEMLRSAYREHDGEPVREVRAGAPVRLGIRNLSTATSEQRSDTLRALLEREVRSPLPLAEGNLLRAALFQLDVAEYVLALTVHRIACDEWSAALLVGELAAAYAALSAGEQPVREPVPPYADFVARQRAATDDAASQGYWLHVLADLPAQPVPTRLERSDEVRFRTAQVRFPIPAELRGDVRALADRRRMTPSMVYLAAFQVVLSRISGDVDVVVGMPVTGRGHPNVDRLVGPVDNTVVLRTDLSGDLEVREVLGRIRAVTLGAYDHRGLPCEWLANELSTPDATGHGELVRNVFRYQGPTRGHPRMGALDVEALDVNAGHGLYDLAVSVEDDGVDALVMIEFATQLFPRSAVEAIAGDYLGAVRHLTGAPDRPLSALIGGTAVAVQPVLTGAVRKARAKRESVAAIEAAIMQVWGEALEHDDIGLEDNFFDIGGHSHMLVEVLPRLQARVDGELRLVDFFRYPTVRELAAHLAMQAISGAENPPPPDRADVETPQRTSEDRRTSLHKQRARRTARAATDQRDKRNAGF